MSGPDEVLEIQGVSVRYGRKTVLRDISLQPIESGHLTVIAGPNGAGKSTLLRAVAGLVPATASVRLGSLDLLRLPVSERAMLVGFMPQTLPQDVDLTVLEAVICSLRTGKRSLSRSGLSDTVLAASMLERLHIAEHGMTRLSRLSGGQRQLASLAQTLVRQPKVLLLDEPTSALDLRHQFKVMSFLRGLADSGLIVIAVIHDLNLAAAWADRIVLTSSGGTAAQGRPKEVLTPELLAEVYGVRVTITELAGNPLAISVNGSLRD